MAINTLTPVTTDTRRLSDTTDRYEIVSGLGYFSVTRNGLSLIDRDGYRRTFTTRNAARKRISRERRGNFHN